MTIKEFITQNPGVALSMMTPGGFVDLTPESAQALLEGQGTLGHPGDPEMAMEIDAEELLPQTVDSVNCSNGIYYLLTGYAEQEIELDESHAPPEVEQGLEMC